MSTGPDGDDEPIELEPEAAGPEEDLEAEGPPAPSGTSGTAGTVPALPPQFKHAPLAQAAAVERGVEQDIALYESEAKAHPEAARRAVLLCEVARLEEQRGADDAALAAARAAFAADPSFPAALWPLRKRLAARELWDELGAAYAAAVAATPLGPEDRADLLVERGRLLEDRLGRDDDAEAAYREALAAAPDHEAALLALHLLGARRGARETVEMALAGLVRRASGPARRAAIATALGRIQRESGTPADEARALATLEEALPGEGADAQAPVAALVRELELLSRASQDPAVRTRVLGVLVRRVAAVDPRLAVALARERARLQSPEEALQTLVEAAKLAPDHPLVASEIVDLAERLERPDVMGEAAARFAAAAADESRVVELSLRRAQALGRMGRHAEALAALDARVTGDALSHALRAALLVQGRDLAGLTDALEAETAGLSGTGAAWALTFAGATRQWLGGASADAEALYRRALEAAPAYRPALDALEAMLRAEGRASERAALLEQALTGGPGAPDPLRETWLREELVAVYRDDLGQPEKALAHAKRLVALAPDDARRRVRLADLEAGGGGPEADTLLALAAVAGDAAVAAALKTEAALIHIAALRRDDARKLLREALPDDTTGLAAGALEQIARDGEGQAEAVADELAGRGAERSPEVARALRFRLAHHLVSGGRLAEAIATLTPLRSEGDALARAWSWDLARRSGDPILEVAVLSDEAAAGGATVAEPAAVLLALGEAFARSGDPSSAADAFRRSMSAEKTASIDADAALGLLRLAAADRAPRPDALPEALRAVAEASVGEPRLQEAVRREGALVRVATGRAEPEDLTAAASADAPAAARSDAAVLRWSAGVRRGDAAAVAEALLELASALVPPSGTTPPEAVPLLARAAARSRLAGPEVAERVHRRVWQMTRAATLAPGLADLPVAPGAGWPADRPDPRRARASRTRGTLGVALDLEAALDAERRGALGAALSDYSRVIAVEPDRLAAWEGIRRVARAGGDVLGEARALARLGTLVKTPARAAELFEAGARLFEQVGRREEAMTLWGKALEARPDDDRAFGRLRELLDDGEPTPERAAALDRLLTHRLGSLSLADGPRLELLRARAHNAAGPLGDLEAAAQDWKRILALDPWQEEALWELSRLALEMGAGGDAVPLLERFLSRTGDEARAAAARLELAACYSATNQAARAVETLRRAAVLRPHDPAPLEQLAELHLARGEWRPAIEIMREWETRLHDARARAALHLRIGAILRDVGRDSAGAAQSFRTAAALDPLGDGARALVSLHDALGDPRGARQTIEREVAQLRQSLDEDPLDAPRLDRLAELLATLRARSAGDALVGDALQAVVEVRALAAGTSVPGRPDPGARPLAVKPRAGGAAGSFFADVAAPGALGFLAEIWPHLHESAAALYPAPAHAVPARETRIAPGADPRLAWIEASVAACGLTGVRLYRAGANAEAPLPILPISPILEPEPGLVFGPAALDGGAEARFALGRALALLRDRATVLEWVSGKDLAALFACAAATVGAPLPAPAPAPTEAMLRTMARAMSRRDRKALALQASRFGFETMDRVGESGLAPLEPVAGGRGDPSRVPDRFTRWQHAVLRTADRLGLLLAGDVAGSVRVVAGAGDAPLTPEMLRASGRARDLLRFALSDAFPGLRREAGGKP